ncbi:hypothetical protein B0O99DRAFT_670446 [Bisporella sp. PMI_857]|nr:hypothetical protein B0O99DRAFT_670446 [Bisporella sp. PMI_857]
MRISWLITLKPTSTKPNIYVLRYGIKGQPDRNKSIYISLAPYEGQSDKRTFSNKITSNKFLAVAPSIAIPPRDFLGLFPGRLRYTDQRPMRAISGPVANLWLDYSQVMGKLNRIKVAKGGEVTNVCLAWEGVNEVKGDESFCQYLRVLVIATRQIMPFDQLIHPSSGAAAQPLDKVGFIDFIIERLATHIIAPVSYSCGRCVFRHLILLRLKHPSGASGEKMSEKFKRESDSDSQDTAGATSTESTISPKNTTRTLADGGGIFPTDLLDDFENVTEKFKLCPNRLWAVAGENLRKLLPVGKQIPSHENHELCTFDFCEHSQRDFTAVEQRHECNKKERCKRLQFPRDILENATVAEKSTVWRLEGYHMINPPQPYMAISHVWSDGTGTGAWPDGEVNECLYAFFRGIAEQFQCEGIWWDTLCIPREKAARNKAIRNIQSNYQDARITLVHDCFLRGWEWVGAEAACFAILISPWFSRGWTALELANSPKAKVVFKGPSGPFIKDLDEQILAKGQDERLSGPRGEATKIIRKLRKGVTTLDDLLTVLGPRHTSWPKDLAIISSLLAGVNVAPTDKERDIWQQDFYKSILWKIGKVAPGHLFHNSATILDVGWCPTNLFNIPRTDSEPSLLIAEDLDLVGTWKLTPVKGISEEYIWNGIHPLIAERLKRQLKSPDECVLLVECGTESTDRALLGKAMEKVGMSTTLRYKYVGALYFHPSLLKKHIEENGIEMKVRLLGDTRKEEAKPAAKNAWELVTQFSRSDSNGIGGESRTDSEAETMKGEDDQAHSNSEAASGGGKNAAEEPLQTEDHNVERAVPERSRLHNAIWRGHHREFPERGYEEMVSSLLTAKAKLDARCNAGQTALHRAAWGGSTRVVELLLGAGRSIVGAKDMDDNLALHIAAEKGFEPIVERLANKEDYTANEIKVTLLPYPIGGGDQNIVELVLRKGTEVNAKDTNGRTPLWRAVENGHEAVLSAAKNGYKAIVWLLGEEEARRSEKRGEIVFKSW